MTLLSRCLSTLTVLFAALTPAVAVAKKVQLEWEPLIAARGYDLKVLKDGKTVKEDSVTMHEWSGNLTPGIYTYRIRAVDRIKRPGSWSEPQSLVVLPLEPSLLTPSPGELFTFYSKELHPELTWKSSQGAMAYRVEIFWRGSKSVLQNMVTEATSIHPKGLAEGEYEWRVIALLNGKKTYEGPPSEHRPFQVIRQELAVPRLLEPEDGDRFPPPHNSRVKFRWSVVKGAELYEVTVERETPEGPKQVTTRTREPFMVLKAPDEGQYTWSVRAVAHVQEGRKPAAVGEISTARFEMTREALFKERTGELAFSGQELFYQYRTFSTLSGYEGKTAARAGGIRLDGAYWIRSRLGVAGHFENLSFRSAGLPLGSASMGAVVQTRISLTPGRYGWWLTGGAGPGLRSYDQVMFDPVTGAALSQRMNTMGSLIQLEAGREVSARWMVRAWLRHYYPLTLSGVPSGSKLESGDSLMNLELAALARYTLNPQWSLGGGAQLARREIGARPTIQSLGLSSGTESMSMTSFGVGAHLIWSFDLSNR